MTIPYDEEIIKTLPANRIYGIQTVNIKRFTLFQQLRQIKVFIGKEGLEEIDDGFDPKDLYHLKLPSTLTTIGMGFLSGNKFIKEFVIPKNVIWIKKFFMQGSMVQKVVTDGTLYLRFNLDDVLNECKQLKYVKLLIDDATVHDSMCDCPKLEQVQITGGFEVIQCFKNSLNIKHIILRLLKLKSPPRQYMDWTTFEINTDKLQYAEISPQLRPNKTVWGIVVRTLEEYQNMYRELQQKKESIIDDKVQKKQFIDETRMQQNDLQVQLYDAIEFGME